MKQARLKTSEIGARISALRKRKGYSQEDLAKILGVSRPVIAQIERGKRNLLAVELAVLSQALEFSFEDFWKAEFDFNQSEKSLPESVPVPGNDMRISVPELKLADFKNVLLYILEKCAGKPNVGETVLYKLLYFSDFDFYELYEEHLTGAEYYKLPYGPVPKGIREILKDMTEKEEIKRIKTEYHGFPQTRYIPLVRPNLSKMLATAKEVIDHVIERYADWSASAISAYSHGDMPWKATLDKKVIDYELVFYRTVPYSVRVYDETKNE